MATTIQPELIPATDRNWKKEDALAPVTPLSLMQIALERGQVEQLQILQDMHFRELARSAEVEFNLAMNEVQAEITRVAPDAYNQQTKSKWATYPALDKMLRPIYTRHGFSLSFDSGDSPADTVITHCYVSHRAGHTRKYQSPPVPLPTMGPQGKAVMTTTHGTGSAMSYGKRYLVAFIFNIPIGDEDTDGNAEQDMPGIEDWLTVIRDSSTFDELDRQFRAAYTQASKADNERAQKILIAAKDERRGQLRKAGAK